ncbi:MAG TPA: DmsC/YnfH family molybdoenzyme membrane anchor subunit [Acidobacteriaceae bacterium]|nr:DmsC/YnfH family molybdoenzyme membrane anchor subunit [Acidobacteriaceae bacterium]
MKLPLLENAKNGSMPVDLLDHRNDPIGAGAQCGAAAAPMPLRLPADGEQYRFHFDMTKCIGCQCCVVACNEQNGNPAHIRWRRVGEIEGGIWPDTSRMYLSMGCNHCLEPTCLEGCPVDAYTKDPLTGIVLHSAERCIGCQYCTWNCSYDVPQYNAERGVVGKCDMCYGRLQEQRAPACVDACPEEAIRIEIVKVADWRAGYAEAANAPGFPSADDSLSTTRITLPVRLSPDLERADAFRVRPEQPHWPLVLMTTLTQTSVGGFCALLLDQWMHSARVVRSAAWASLLVVAIALAASTLHLGRPAYAWRALSMWRRSWLSREVLLFTAFAGLGLVYVVALWWSGGLAMLFGLCTVAAGIAAVFASARIYIVRARPAWNSGHTLAEFFLSAAFSGPLFAALFLPDLQRSLLVFAAGAAAATLLEQMVRLLWLANSDVFEMRATARLLSTRLRPWLLARAAGLIGASFLLMRPTAGVAWTMAALVLALALEVLGRWLFFVSVVPKSVASTYLQAREAA